MKQRKDIFGAPIYVDDIIVYGSGRGGISYGKVNLVSHKQVEQYNYQTKATEWVEQVKLKVTVIPYYKDGVRNVTLSEACSIVKVNEDTRSLIKTLLDEPVVV